MKILICDDDELFIKENYDAVSEYALKNNLNFDIEATTNSFELLNTKNFYDIALLDINMPSVTGLTLVSHLNKINKNIQIFIITSHSCYLDNAMDLNVFRYINKPIDKDRLFRGLDIAIERYNLDKQIIKLYDGNSTQSTAINDIIYITIEKRKVVFVTKTAKYYSNNKLSFWADELKCFNNIAQSHHSYMVNLNYVKKFDRTGILLEFGDSTISVPLSQRNYSIFKKLYYSYLGV